MECNKKSFNQNLIFAIKFLLIASIFWSNLTAIGRAGSIEHAQENDGQVSLKANENEQPTENESKTSAWSLIDWSSYKTKFNKNYSSLSQQLLRQKIFMSKQIQVFFGWANWRLQKSGYFTSINQFSDLTPEEEQQKMRGDDGEYPSDDEDDDDMMDDEQARRALLEELEEEEEFEEALPRNEFNNKRKPLDRHKRSLMSDLINQNLDMAALVRVPSSTDSSNAELKIQWVVPSTNPDYQQVEAESFGVDSEVSQKVQDIPKEDVEEIVSSSSTWLALPKLIGDTAVGTVKWLRSNSFRSPSSKEQMLKDVEVTNTVKDASEVSPKASAETNVVIDWRKSGCVAPPIDQRDCQSCYAVSSMAFLEWAFCMNQNRTLTPLSVQYFISCGPQYKQEADPALKIQFYGCDRGRSRQAMYFVKEYGVVLAAHMPYLARNTECPVARNTPLKHKGYIRPNVKQHVRMAATTTQLELALKVGPVIVNFREPLDFLAYGGGMVGRCYQRGGHAMLVVGHGVENGIPYLIIKNSFGTNWGMKGYFKFDRKYTQECVKDFILPRVSFPSKKAQNRRVKAYLASQQASKSNWASSTSDLAGIFDVGSGGLFSLN